MPSTRGLFSLFPFELYIQLMGIHIARSCITREVVTKFRASLNKKSRGPSNASRADLYVSIGLSESPQSRSDQDDSSPKMHLLVLSIQNTIQYSVCQTVV